jgi:hypothetical protein
MKYFLTILYSPVIILYVAIVFPALFLMWLLGKLTGDDAPLFTE